MKFGTPAQTPLLLEGARDTLVRVGHSHAKRRHHQHLVSFKEDAVAPLELLHNLIPKLTQARNGRKGQRIL